MSADAWITLLVVVATVAILMTERLSPAVAVFGATTTLLVTGVIDAGQAFAGFSNPAPITVAALYVLAAAVEKTGTLERLTTLLGPREPAASASRGVLARVLIPTAAASSFLNNTPIVAMVSPVVVGWTRRTGRSPSTFLMPVSFAAILGGVVTLIGTSTNLVVSGLLLAAGERPMGLFEIGYVGVPFAVSGLILLIVLAPVVLPERRAPSQSIGEDAREFTVEMVVSASSPLAGKSVNEAGLRNLEGVFLVELERAGRVVSPVTPGEVLVKGDRLTFAGNVNRVLDLQRIPGLTSGEERHFPGEAEGPQRRFFEAVVADGSVLAGSTLKEVGFRSRFGGAVLAIHRAGERLTAKLGDVTLRTGDLLLILAGSDFKRHARERRDFLVVAPISGESPPSRKKAPLVGLVTAALFLLVGTGTMEILEAALLSALALVGLGVLTPREAKSAVDLNVIVVIASSFGIGTALAVSGLAQTLAGTVIAPMGGLGDLGLLLGILFATTLLTELITNNAAAVLMFPIALATAAQAGLDLRPFAFAVAIGASASFLSPIGYQTNTMVYGMGGYHFGDFARLGLPLTILMFIVAGLVIPLAWPLR